MPDRNRGAQKINSCGPNQLDSQVGETCGLVRFSVGFWLAYITGSYFFFNRLPIPFATQDTFEALPVFLFFFGCAAVVGTALFKHLTFQQSAGLLTLYLVALVLFVFLFGEGMGTDLSLPADGSIEEFLIALPFGLFFVMIPMAVGYGLYRGFYLREMVGASILVGFSLLVLSIGTSVYFERPWASFAYHLGPYSRGWIEVGSVLLLVLGTLGTLGYCLINSYTFRESVGSLLVFLSVIAGVFIVIHLSIGYQVIGKAFGG